MRYIWSNRNYSALVASIIKAVNITEIDSDPTDLTCIHSIFFILGLAKQSTDIMFGLQFWFWYGLSYPSLKHRSNMFPLSSIENTTLIVAATIPTLRPLLSRKQYIKTPQGGSGPSAYGQSRSTAWRFHKRPTETTLPSVDSDDVELTGRPGLVRGSRTDTEYLAADGTNLTAPGIGIMRTMETKVVY